jgi:hypothetical protein
MSDIRNKKLSLNKETLLHLTNADLANVVGGGDSDLCILSRFGKCITPKPSGSNLLCPPPPPNPPGQSKAQFRCPDPIVPGPVNVTGTVHYTGPLNMI